MFNTKNCFIHILIVTLLLPVFILAGDENMVIKTTICELYTEPQKYAGKMIEVRATIFGNRLELPRLSSQGRCSSRGYMDIILEYPQNVKPMPNFDLQKDLGFKEYKDSSEKGMYIEATLIGRFDPVFVWLNQKRVKIGNGEGFGDNNSADARLVLWKISNIVKRPRVVL